MTNKKRPDKDFKDSTVNPIDGSIGGGFAERNEVVVGKEEHSKADQSDYIRPVRENFYNS